jgi:hypothetical protein
VPNDRAADDTPVSDSDLPVNAAGSGVTTAGPFTVQSAGAAPAASWSNVSDSTTGGPAAACTAPTLGALAGTGASVSGKAAAAGTGTPEPSAGEPASSR